MRLSWCKKVCKKNLTLFPSARRNSANTELWILTLAICSSTKYSQTPIKCQASQSHGLSTPAPYNQVRRGMDTRYLIKATKNEVCDKSTSWGKDGKIWSKNRREGTGCIPHVISFNPYHWRLSNFLKVTGQLSVRIKLWTQVWMNPKSMLFRCHTASPNHFLQQLVRKY